jgi:hypothetical protein
MNIISYHFFLIIFLVDLLFNSLIVGFFEFGTEAYLFLKLFKVLSTITL